MTTPKPYALNDRYLADSGRVFLTGIQALARLPLEQLRADRRAGLETAALISGYQGSPLGGYDGAVAAAAALAPDLPVICRPAMNEEFGASAVMGSQLAAAQPDCLYDGIVGIWYGKAPGVDRAADALRHAVYAGTSMNGGAVAIVGDDPAAKSSTLPSSSAGVLADMNIPLLYPGDPGEALLLGRHAIALSRLTGLWSALKIVADVADATATVDLGVDPFSPILPNLEGMGVERYVHRPDGNLLTPRTIGVEREIYEIRYQLARRYALVNALNEVTVNPRNAWIGIVSSGITYREVREAFGRLGLRTDREIESCGIRLLKMSMPMPFEPETVQRFAEGLETLFVIEEKRPSVESLVKDALYGLSQRPIVIGKADEAGELLVPGFGALDADALVPILRRRLEGRLRDRLAPPMSRESRAVTPLEVTRTPFYCSGCPHNRSTRAPTGSLVGAGIGCHTMALLMDPARVGDIGGLGCMGNEGIQWIGMSDFLERDHFIQNLGDGTFFHSGQLAIQASVAAGVHVTYKLLYNGTVAMTGGQDPQGQIGVPEIACNLLNQRVARVLITTDEPDRYRGVDLPDGVDVWNRDRIVEAQETLARTPGVTVLIHDQGCAAEARRARKRGRIESPRERVAINHRLCEGCGDCGQVSNCLSVQPFETPFGRKTQIDQTTCNLDYSCLEGDCPSFMTATSKKPGSGWLANQFGRGSKSREDPNRAIPEPPSDLPDPTRIVPDSDFAMRITGIGGTGVVTVAQVVGTAAMLDGYHVRGLDQIGLSQKAGPVVSDLRLSRVAPTATNRLGEAQADLLLAFDQLVAASEKGLLTAHPERTTVVGSTTATPTGEMITHPEVSLPAANDLIKRIAGLTRADAQFWADATETTQALFGNSTTANLFVVGMAVQAGCLPVESKSIEEAIELNGVAVDSNRSAFRWGRASIARPESVEAARDAALASALAPKHKSSSPPDSRLSVSLRHRIEAIAEDQAIVPSLERYAEELVAWQNEKTASGWLELLEQVAATERRVAPASRRLLLAVAEHSFKLTAYKDEYEVARLMTDEDGLSSARELATRGGRLAWRLHPPILRALGMRRKLKIGLWAWPLVRLLARAKGLRRTPLDLFGWPEIRRLERRLPGEYQETIEGMLASLTRANLDRAVEIACLPDQVRGYEELKLARISAYRAEMATLVDAFGKV